jgi:hypothetical protein
MNLYGITGLGREELHRWLSNLPFLKVINKAPFMIVNSLVWVVVAMLVILMRRGLFFASMK